MNASIRAIRIAPLLLAVAAGCARAPEERRVAFACENGTEIEVVFAGDEARITRPGARPMVLRQRPAGSGYWYESATHGLRGKGREVMYTIGRAAPVTCHERDAQTGR